MNEIMKIFILLVFFIITGCNDRTVKENSDFYNPHIKVMRLEDGTRCVVIGHQSGISCDWDGNK